MNDFDYDVMQKKRIARGAFHKVNGSRSKGCRLPFENLTKKEREALNGEVFTINTLEKVSWERFKTLPAGLQTEYLQHLMDRFGVGLATIGRELFGLSKSALGMYVSEHDLKLTTRTGGRISKAAYTSWLRWLNSDPIFAPVIEDTDEPEPTPAEEPEPAEERVPIMPENETRPFRAHDFGAVLRAMPERETPATPDPNPTSVSENPYPMTDLSLTLKGTPIDILTTMRMSFPALLDKDKTYRFQIKVDGYVL